MIKQTTSTSVFRSKITRVTPFNVKTKLKTFSPIVKTKFSPDFIDGINSSSYFIGKGVILFTMFYCSMNWVYYRGMRL